MDSSSALITKTVKEGKSTAKTETAVSLSKRTSFMKQVRTKQLEYSLLVTADLNMTMVVSVTHASV